MPKITPYKIKKLGIQFSNNPVVMLSYKGKYSQDDIVKHAQHQSNLYKTKLGKQAQIMITVKYEDKWRTGGFTDVGEPVSFFEDSDWYADALPTPDSFSEFRIYVQKM